MGCCKDKGSHDNKCCGSGLQNSAFLIIVLFILLAIILGGVLYY